MIERRSKIDGLYEKIANEEDARVCKDISDDACKYVPVNFFYQIIANTLMKFGDALSSPKTVLAWLITYVNAPVFFIGLLVPIRESLSMLPQLFIAGYIRKLPKRKWTWVAGSILQGLSIFGIGLSAIFFRGLTAGLCIILFLHIFSLSRGICSVSTKDVIGKTIPKTRRGLMSGLSTSISGLLALAVGVFLLSGPVSSRTAEFYGWLIIGSGTLWIIAAFVFALVREFPGETGGGGNAISEAMRRLSLFKTDRPFRLFVIARALFLCSALTAPYYVVLTQERFGNEAYLLGLFVIGNGLASSISAPIWGKMADISSKRVMMYAASISALLGVITFIIAEFMPVVGSLKWVYPLAFFILGISHSGVRLGRSTYIVDMAGGNKRTDYVAVSNTIIGAVLLVTGLVGSLSSLVSPAGIILILSIFGIFGVILGSRLPEVENE